MSFWEDARSLQVTSTLADMWYARYGLSLPESAEAPSVAENALDHKAVVRMLGYHAEHDGPLTEKQWDLLALLLGVFKPRANSSGVSLQALRGVCDLFVDSGLTHPVRLPHRRLMLRESHSEDDLLYYVFTMPYDDIEKTSGPSVQPWRIAVRDPLTVNHVLRSRWPNKDVLLQELVARGCTFRLLRPGDSTTEKHVAKWQSRVGLAILAYGSAPPPNAYQHYLMRRHQLLSELKGRTALCAGGMIWRLAMDTAGVAEGAFNDMTFHCPTFHIRLGESKLLWADDDLTPQERDLIVGVYRVSTGAYCCERVDLY